MTLNKSLREKSASRLMAIQITYSFQATGRRIDAARMLADLDVLASGEKGSEFPSVFKEKAHKPTLERLIEGYADHHEVLAPIAREALHDDWKPERVNPLLLIILEYAALELDHQRQLADGVIVGEYTDMAARLLDAADVDFVHASLKKLAAKLRG